MGEGVSHGWAFTEERPWCSITFKCLNDFGYIRCSPNYLMWSQKEDLLLRLFGVPGGQKYNITIDTKYCEHDDIHK